MISFHWAGWGLQFSHTSSSPGGWRSPSQQLFAFPARTMEAAAPLGSASTQALALGTAPAPGTALGMASPAVAKCIR